MLEFSDAKLLSFEEGKQIVDQNSCNHIMEKMSNKISYNRSTAPTMNHAIEFVFAELGMGCRFLRGFCAPDGNQTNNFFFLFFPFFRCFRYFANSVGVISCLVLPR